MGQHVGLEPGAANGAGACSQLAPLTAPGAFKMFHKSATHPTLVCAMPSLPDTSTSRIVGSATAAIERKFIHQCSKVGSSSMGERYGLYGLCQGMISQRGSCT